MTGDDRRTDLDLVDAANRGDPDAFEALYLRYRDWVVSLAWRFTRNRADALDVMQETFTYLLRKFPSGGASGQARGFTLTAQMKTFLYPAVRNLSIAARRKRDRYLTDDDLLADFPDAETTHTAGRAELAQVMSALKPIHCEVVLMRFVDGLTLEEIATALDVPLGTVKSRLHTALNVLRDDPCTREYFEPP